MPGPLSPHDAVVLSTVNLYFVAQSGTKQLAAASLGTSITIMFSKLVLLGLCGALDTQASQASGWCRIPGQCMVSR